jgi:hypothetical protein
VVSFTLQTLYPYGKSPKVRTGYESRWAPGKVWTLWKKSRSGIRNLASKLIAIPTESSLRNPQFVKYVARARYWTSSL